MAGPGSVVQCCVAGTVLHAGVRALGDSVTACWHSLTLVSRWRTLSSSPSLAAAQIPRVKSSSGEEVIVITVFN